MKMTNEQLIVMAQIALPDRIPLKLEIRDIVNKLCTAFEVSAADQEVVLNTLLTQRSVQIDLLTD